MEEGQCNPEIASCVVPMSSAPEPELAESRSPLPQTAGQGLLTMHDTAKRLAYLKRIHDASDAAVAEIQAARAAGDLAKAERMAREVSALRNAVRTETQALLSPGGRLMSRTLEQPRDWAKQFNRYGGTESFETYESIAKGAGRSSPSVTGLAKFGRVAGPAAAAFGLAAGGYELYEAPEAERPRVLTREVGGIAGGAAGSTLGTAGGTLGAAGLALLLGLEGPPGWLVLALGLGGGVAGGVGGSKAGREGGEILHDSIIAPGMQRVVENEEKLRKAGVVNPYPVGLMSAGW